MSSSLLVDTLLSPGEATTFIRSNLHMAVDDDFRFAPGQGALDFLNALVTSYVQHVPCQSVRFLAWEPRERRRLTWPEVKADVISGKGGLCYSLNSFLCAVIGCLGYDVCLAHSTCYIHHDLHPNDHLVIFVRNVVEGADLYLIEVGFGEPTFQVVDLNTGVESPVYENGGVRYKYVRHDGKILRLHETRVDADGTTMSRRRPRPHDLILGSCWIRAYDAELTGHKNLDEFDAAFDAAFAPSSGFLFHRVLYFSLYPGLHRVLMVNGKLRTEKDGEMEVKTLKNDEDIVETLMRYLEPMGEDTIRKAVGHWREAGTELTTYWM